MNELTLNTTNPTSLDLKKKSHHHRVLQVLRMSKDLS